MSLNPIKVCLVLVAAALVLHICIIIKFIPYELTWGGRLKNDSEMYVFETLSILINVFFAWVLMMKGNYTSFKFSDKSIRIILWVFFVLFLLNTIGNVFAKTNFEKSLAAYTLLLAILLFQILRNKKLS